MRNRFLLFYFFIYSLSCTAQSLSKTYTDMYDLNFTMVDSSIVHPWIENAAYSNYTTPVYIEDSDSSLFARKYLKMFPFTDRLRVEYEQRILLPVHHEKEGSVEFEGKGENLAAVTIWLDGIDAEEKIVFSDTVVFILDNSLNRISQKIPLSGIDMLNVRIHAEGEVHKDAMIAFSQLSIIIDNKSIDEYPVREVSPLLLPKNVDFISLYPKQGRGYEKIDVIKNKKIIGLGESVHNNPSIKHLVYQLMAEAVKTQKCKLVLWEMPLEKSFIYNRYIRDNKAEFISSTSLDEQTKSFLDTLRSYNQNEKPEDRVWLLGMDYNHLFNSNQNSAVDIFDFMTHLNQETKIPEIDQLSVLLMDKKWDNAIHFLEKNKNKIQVLLTIDEIECILHILKLSQNMGRDGIRRSMYRDSIMFVNTDFLINRFAATPDTKVVVYAHCAHINPISTYPAIHSDPMGMYMKKKYTGDYCLLALLVGEGEVIAYNAGYDKVENSLLSPPIGSIEYFLKSLKQEVLFLPVTSDLNRIVLSRFKGSHHISQEFYPANFYQRYAGVFFINNLMYDTRPEKRKLSFKEASEEFIMKNKQRQKILEDIKQRISN